MNMPLRLGFVAAIIAAIAGTVAFRPDNMALFIACALGFFKALPLLLFSRAVWRQLPDGLLVLTLVLLFYLGFAAMQCFLPGAAGLYGLLFTGILSVLLLQCLWVVRLQAKARKAQAAQPEA